ncbi:hypothetical protein ACQ4ZQ_003033 [Acinetobacter baumannii]
MYNPSDIEAHQYTGSLLSLNAIQLWIITGEYMDVCDHHAKKFNEGYLHAIFDNNQTARLQISKGDWVICENGKFYKVSSTDYAKLTPALHQTA